MKAIIIVFSIIYFSNHSFAKTQRDTSFLNIDFQDFFTHDTVSLSINGTVILKNVIMTSEVVGLVNVPVTIFQKGQKRLFVKLHGENKEIRAEKLITLIVTLNGRTSRYEVDCRKGKYVGFNKVNNQIAFVQQEKRFTYE